MLWNAVSSPEVVPSAISCWVCGFGVRCQRGESEGRKTNVRFWGKDTGIFTDCE